MQSIIYLLANQIACFIVTMLRVIWRMYYKQADCLFTVVMIRLVLQMN